MDQKFRTAGQSRADAGAPTRLELKLPFRLPFWPDSLFGHLAATAVPGVEEWRDGAYRCTMRLPHGPAIAGLRPTPDFIACTLTVSDLRDRSAAMECCRWLLDLDADPVAIDGRLAADPVLAPLVARAPGRRVPRSLDPAQLAIRAVLGQQISTAAARTHAGRLVAAYGDPIDDPDGGLTHLFPTVEGLAELDPESLAMPRTRRATVIGLIEALRDGRVELSVGGDWNRARNQLGELPGIGPWTVETIAMRGLGDPDAFIPGDLGVRLAAEKLGLLSKPRALIERSEPWRPWRAYAVQHLWATGTHAVNQFPSVGG